MYRKTVLQVHASQLATAIIQDFSQHFWVVDVSTIEVTQVGNNVRIAGSPQVTFFFDDGGAFLSTPTGDDRATASEASVAGAGRTITKRDFFWFVRSDNTPHILTCRERERIF